MPRSARNAARQCLNLALANCIVPAQPTPAASSARSKTEMAKRIARRQVESSVTQIRGNKLALNIAGSVLTLVLAAVGILLAHQLPHYTPFAEWHPLALLLSLCVIIPFHELLHAVGAMWFGNIAWRDLKFGVLWRALTPYCHCRVPGCVQAW